MTRAAETPCAAAFVAAYAAHRARLAGASLAWLARAREAAIERFAELGLPSTRDEDWKYTSVAAIERRAFALALAAPPDGAGEAELERHALAATHRLVFVDGHHAPRLSRLGALPAGARIGSLAAAAAARDERLAEAFTEAFPDGAAADGFDALNAALWSDGAWVELDPGVVLDAPLHLLFVATRDGVASFPRNLVRAADGAALTLIEHHVGGDAAAHLTAAATRIVAGAGARVAHVKLQQEGRGSFHIATVAAEQRRDSRLVSHAFAFGGRLARSALATRLAGEGCDARLTGLYVAGGRQHLDHHTTIDHAAPRGTSRELYKGVLDGAARAVFNGRVLVRPGAQHSDALQSNRNLLLSDDAEVDTKPQLEIWADDVKCAHGATVGRLDADPLYYLRARGIAEADARALLIRAFAADTLAGIEHPALRARLEALLPGAVPECL